MLDTQFLFYQLITIERLDVCGGPDVHIDAAARRNMEISIRPVKRVSYDVLLRESEYQPTTPDGRSRRWLRAGINCRVRMLYMPQWHKRLQ